MIEFAKELIKELLKPLSKGAISIKPGGVNKDGNSALVLPYADSRAIQNRLDEACPGNWSFDWEAAPAFGNSLAVKGMLTVCGVTRCDVGQAEMPTRPDEEPYKAAVSDALKRCAVQFGVGRYLYDLPLVWWPGKRGQNGKNFYFTNPQTALDYIESVIAAVVAGKAIPKSPVASGSSSDRSSQPTQSRPQPQPQQRQGSAKGATHFAGEDKSPRVSEEKAAQCAGALSSMSTNERNRFLMETLGHCPDPAEMTLREHTTVMAAIRAIAA